jgi:hypothetical protein
MKPPIPLEHDEQVALTGWLEAKKLKFTSIPNAAKRSYKLANYLHSEGFRVGIADMVVFVPRPAPKYAKALFIEMKRTKGGVTSPEQAEWIDCLNKVPGVSAAVCKGFEEARAFVEGFL